MTPLEEWLGDIPQKFKSHVLENWEIFGEKNYDVASNYKLIEENFMEYYHLPFVHPELTNVSRMEDHHRSQGTGMYTGMLTTPVSRDVDSVWLNLPAGTWLEQRTSGGSVSHLYFPQCHNHHTTKSCFLYDHRPDMCKPNQGTYLLTNTLQGLWKTSRTLLCF